MIRHQRFSCISFLFILLVVAPTSAKNINDNCQAIAISSDVRSHSVSSSQIIVVKALGGSKSSITACQKQGNEWRQELALSFMGIIGKGGVAHIGEKKEGDFKTPAGFYPLGDAFGTQTLALKMDYKYITLDDKFVDDVNSKHYNTWVTGVTDAKSYESMLIKPYKLGVVVNYNMNPVIAGAGSAIFMHVWKASDIPTFGCVAMDEQHLLALLHWLDKKQRPHILIIPTNN